MCRIVLDPVLEPIAALSGKPARIALRPLNPLILQPIPRAFRTAGDRAVDSAFAAGAALSALDQVVRADPPWLGTLRMRQALAAAAASSRLLRLREDESALRDAHHLTRPADRRRPGNDPGPAGRLHRAWRDFAARPTRLGTATLERLAQELGIPPPCPVPQKPAGSPVCAAGTAASEVALAAGELRRPVETDVLAVMAADLVLANRLGWTTPMPLLATAILHPTLRRGPEGRRVRPGEETWPEVCLRAFALAALEAQALAIELDRRAEKLLTVAGRVRTRGGEAGIVALLADDALSAALLNQKLGSDRAARRFLDRLVALGGIRELTGRSTFRLYGL